MLNLKRYRKYLIMGCIIALVSALMLPHRNMDTGTPRDMDEIRESGLLRVAVEYGKNSYFLNGEGEPEGFHYELARRFAEAHGLQLEVIPEMSLQEQDRLLSEGRCDIVLGGRQLLAVEDTARSYTLPVAVDRQIIIQRKEELAGDSTCPFLHTQLELAGKTVCIPENSAIRQRIRHFMEETGDTVYVEEVPRYGAEQLMALVAHGDRCYAICEEHVVKAHIHHYPQLDDRLAFSFNQFYSWVVSPQSPVLLDSLNSWIQREGLNKRVCE